MEYIQKWKSSKDYNSPCNYSDTPCNYFDEHEKIHIDNLKLPTWH